MKVELGKSLPGERVRERERGQIYPGKVKATLQRTTPPHSALPSLLSGPVIALTSQLACTCYI